MTIHLRRFRTGLLVIATLLLHPGPGVGAADEEENASQVPRAVLSASEYDFGRAQPGSTVRHSVALSNEGMAPLRIEETRTSSRWLSVEAPESLGPASGAELSISLDTSALDGPFDGEVVLVTNDPSHPELHLRVHGQVGPEVAVLPRPILPLRAFTWQKGNAEASVTLVNRSAGLLEIEGVEGGGKSFTTEVTELEKGQRYEVTIRFRPDAPPGMESARLRVRTNKGAVPVLALTLVKQRVYALPPSVDFGNVDRSAIVEDPSLLDLVAQTFHVYRLGDDEFRIEADVDLPFLDVAVKPADGPGVVIDIPGQGPTAVFDLVVTPRLDLLKPGPFEGKVRVKTSDPEISELEIPVRGNVQ